MIFLAGVIASLGLATNNAVMIVAAMLLSPLMGPIVGVTFATMTGDRDLFLTSLRNEAIGMLETFIVGLLMGLALTPFAAEMGWPTGMT